MSVRHHVRASFPAGRRTLPGDLAPLKRVWLSRGLVAFCLWRLEQILLRCNPLDHPLASFLKAQIVAEEESANSLKQLDLALHWSIDVDFCPEECDELLSSYLPSAFGRAGDGLMDRDTALHCVEILEIERQCFFSHILEGLSEDPPGSRLKVESDESAHRLHLVRTVLLAPADKRFSEDPTPG